MSTLDFTSAELLFIYGLVKHTQAPSGISIKRKLEVVADRRQAHHQPRRGDEVEAWIKRMRDRYVSGPLEPACPEWTALDNLLDRYRECSDCGLTLLEEDDNRGDP